MAIVNLQEPVWKYDTSTQELLLGFREAPADNETDPASFRPTKAYVLRVPVPLNKVQIVDISLLG